MLYFPVRENVLHDVFVFVNQFLSAVFEVKIFLDKMAFQREEFVLFKIGLRRISQMKTNNRRKLIFIPHFIFQRSNIDNLDIKTVDKYLKLLYSSSSKKYAKYHVNYFLIPKLSMISLSISAIPSVSRARISIYSAARASLSSFSFFSALNRVQTFERTKFRKITPRSIDSYS